MGWFTPIKGATYSMAQVDKTLPVDPAEANEKIVRGSIIQANDKGAFELADGSQKLVYIALQDYADTQAAMAGGVVYEAGDITITQKPDMRSNVIQSQPRLTGLLLRKEEYQTDVYDDNLADAKVGDFLTVKDGMLSKGTEENAVAVVTVPPFTRWVNNAIAKDGKDGLPWRRGANRTVIQFTGI
jgi:hypothetical protein